MRNNPRQPQKRPKDAPPSRTAQAPASEVSLQGILARHNYLPAGQSRQLEFGKWSPPDFHAAMNLVQDVRNTFMTLDARIRSRFQNDPYQLLRFVEDPKNRSEGLRLGLLTPTEDEARAMWRARAKSLRVEQLDIEREIKAEEEKAAPGGAA